MPTTWRSYRDRGLCDVGLDATVVVGTGAATTEKLGSRRGSRVGWMPIRAALTGKHDTLVRRAHQMLNAALMPTPFLYAVPPFPVSRYFRTHVSPTPFHTRLSFSPYVQQAGLGRDLQNILRFIVRLSQVYRKIDLR